MFSTLHFPIVFSAKWSILGRWISIKVLLINALIIRQIPSMLYREIVLFLQRIG